ncbi:hypothetical protein Pcinc_030291 [Petrolisthes cinctipes]|uniref:Uncharacterized protein n=1 Tax=Petrolisthes cinctipes TaxID=88211 RepID=A0AAE1K2S8_PETCI|nr:hypothetical protein Pcinc_030291 [Petrolisthes cinctipes]
MVLATAITKTEEVGWDPNHLILPSQSSYLHQDNLALRSTCYVLYHIGGLAASLAFLRTQSLEEVQSLRGWASASSFRSRYLMHDAQDISFVALKTLTQVSSADRDDTVTKLHQTGINSKRQVVTLVTQRHSPT